MSNPDGTHTKDEHREAILALASQYVRDGMEAEDAIAKAGAEWRARIKAEGDRKIAGVMKFLGVRQH